MMNLKQKVEESIVVFIEMFIKKANKYSVQFLDVEYASYAINRNWLDNLAMICIVLVKST